MPPTTLKPQTTDTNGITLRSFAYLLPWILYVVRISAIIINIRRYITSARGHELSGRVCVHAYNYYAWAECAWVAIIMVQPKICDQYSWLHNIILQCTVVITLKNLASFPSYSCLVYMILCHMIMQFYY